MAKVTDLQSALNYIREIQSGSWLTDVRITAIAVPKAARDKIIDEMGCGPIPVTREMLKLYDDNAPTEVKLLGVIVKEQEPGERRV